MSYSQQYKERIQHMARLYPNMQSRQIVEAVPAGPGDKIPNIKTIQNWIRQVIGTKRPCPSKNWTDELREEARRLIIGEGWVLWRVRNHFRDNHGFTPQAETLRRLMPEGWVYAHERKKASSRPVLHETPGDSWQRAWDAADGLDGAAWAEAVMSEWLPDERQHTADDLKQFRKKAKASADGRRMAA